MRRPNMSIYVCEGPNTRSEDHCERVYRDEKMDPISYIIVVEFAGKF